MTWSAQSWCELLASERAQSQIGRDVIRWIADHFLLLTVLFALLLLNPSALSPLGFFGLIGLWLARWIVKGSPVPKVVSNPLLLLFMVMVAVGLAISSAQDLAVVRVGRLLGGIALTIGVTDYVKNIDDAWRITRALAVLGILLVLIIPFTTNWRSRLFPVRDLLPEGFPQVLSETSPNIVASGLAPLVPICLALTIHDRRRLNPGVLAVIPLVATILLLQSRGGLLSVSIGIAVWLVLYYRWLIPVFGGILAMGAWLIVRNGGLMALPFASPALMKETVESFTERVALWRQAIYLMHQSAVWGIGFGAYPRIAPFAPPHSLSKPGPILEHAHNLFLQVALDTGVIGLSAFLGIVGLSMWTAWKAKKQLLLKHLAHGLLAAWAVVVSHGMFDATLWCTRPGALFWILVGLSLSLAPMHPAIVKEDQKS